MAAIIIQARLGSTRFPEKVLQPLPNGKRIIDTIVDAALASDASDVAVVTPDTKLKNLLNIPVFVWEGPRDVLAEFYHAAKHYQDDIIRLTADCPLLTPDIINSVLHAYYMQGVDYMYNSHDDEGGFNDGFDVEIFSFDSLKEAHEKATDEYDREHVTPYIRRHFKCGRYMEGCSVNTYEDYVKVCQIMEKQNDRGAKG